MQNVKDYGPNLVANTYRQVFPFLQDNIEDMTQNKGREETKNEEEGEQEEKYQKVKNERFKGITAYKNDDN